MRAALLAVIAVIAGCGGGTRPPKPIENTAVPQARPWTVDRVRSTLPPDTSIVVKLATGPIRSSEILGPMWEKLTAEALKKAGVCQEMKDIDATIMIVVSGTEESPVMALWVLDTSVASMRACMDRLAATPPADVQIKVDGDFVSITTGPDGPLGGILILDEHSAVVSFERSPSLARARLQAQTQERADAFHDAALDELFASPAPVWGYGSAAAPMLAKTAGGRLRTLAVTVGIAKLIDVDARVRMNRPDDAATTAQLIQTQGASIVQMGMATEVKATAQADVLVVHATFSKASLDRMMSMFGGMLGGGGAPGPMQPPGP
jgi:hypothetical protein